MQPEVTAQAVRDQRRGILGWSVSLALLVGMYVAMWPSVRDEPSLSEFFDKLPEGVRALFSASGADYSTPTGYVQVEMLSFMAPILLLVHAIGAGSSAIAGEEERHTLDLLLGTPVSRTRLVLEKLLALVLTTTVLGVVMGVALLGEGLLVDLGLPVGHVVAAMTHLVLLGLVFGALALATGAVTGHPSRARAVPAAVAVLAYVVNGLAPVVSWLEPFQKLSPFYQYAGHEPLAHGFSVAAVVVSVLTVVVLAVVAVVGFRRRDVAV